MNDCRYRRLTPKPCDFIDFQIRGQKQNNSLQKRWIMRRRKIVLLILYKTYNRSAAPHYAPLWLCWHGRVVFSSKAIVRTAKGSADFMHFLYVVQAKINTSPVCGACRIARKVRALTCSSEHTFPRYRRAERGTV